MAVGTTIPCNGCGACAESCSVECIKLGFVNGYINTIFIDADSCLCCGACIGWCPHDEFTYFIRDYVCPGLDLGWGTPGGTEGGEEGGGNGGDGGEGNPGEVGGGDDGKYRIIGMQCFQKIKNDLENKNVIINQVQYREGYPVLDAAGVGLNTTGIITSCLNFLEQTNLDRYALSFGKRMGYAGLLVGGTQTFIAFTDGDISTADILSAVSTALAAASLACALFPATIVVGGILGIASCVVGLVAVAAGARSTGPLILNVDGKKRIYLYLEENS